MNIHPNEFLALLQKHSITEGYFLQENEQLQASHKALQNFAKDLETWADYQNHEGIFFEVDSASNSLFTAFVHNTVRGQACGGVRLQSYETVEALFQDGLRLAKGMADKNAIARLWWGGGKGIICRENIHDLSKEERQNMFKKYGLFLSKLNGVYVTAEDMNVKPDDLADVFATCRYATCIPEVYGGSANPSIFTAKGVFSGIKAAAAFKYGTTEPLKGKKVLLQGAGNVGCHVLEQLIEAGAKVFVFDVNKRTLEGLKRNFTSEQVEVVAVLNDFWKIEADILSPNAIGAILNDQTIADLKVGIIAGGANNQLLDSDKHGKVLHEKGIIYLPDFFINRLGIINCANEQYGYVRSDIEREVELVYTDSLDLLQKAKEQDCSPQVIAAQIAAERMKEPHPIWGHRGPKLVAEVLKSGFGKIQEIEMS